MATTELTTSRLEELLGDDADDLLDHKCADRRRVATCTCRAPTSSTASSSTPTAPAASCATSSGCSTTGRLAGTGYVLDPARSTRASSTRRGASFAPNPIYFDPENIVRAGDRGRLQRRRLDGRRARRGQPQVRAQDPLHRQAQPQRAADVPERVRPDHVRARSSARTTWARPASARRSTSARRESRRQIVEVARGLRGGPPARHVHRALVLPAQPGFKIDGTDYHVAADLTGQANHLGVTIEADIIKQKLPENNGGYTALNAERRVVRQDAQARLREAHDRPPDRPDAATRSSTATWAAPALINSRRRVVAARPTSPRPSRPRSSTSAPAAWA